MSRNSNIINEKTEQIMGEVFEKEFTDVPIEKGLEKRIYVFVRVSDFNKEEELTLLKLEDTVEDDSMRKRLREVSGAEGIIYMTEEAYRMESLGIEDEEGMLRAVTHMEIIEWYCRDKDEETLNQYIEKYYVGLEVDAEGELKLFLDDILGWYLLSIVQAARSGKNIYIYKEYLDGTIIEMESTSKEVLNELEMRGVVVENFFYEKLNPLAFARFNAGLKDKLDDKLIAIMEEEDLEEAHMLVQDTLTKKGYVLSTVRSGEDVFDTLIAKYDKVIKLESKPFKLIKTAK